MKCLPVLKMITQITFVFAVIIAVFIVPAYIMLLVMPGMVPFKINGKTGGSLGPEPLIMLLLAIVSFAFFVYALYLFRKVLDLFSKRKFFDDGVIKNFKQIGKAVIIADVIANVPAFIYNTIVTPAHEVNFTYSFESFLIVMGLGLFFIVLSEVFLAARNMKKENDLTI